VRQSGSIIKACGIDLMAKITADAFASYAGYCCRIGIVRMVNRGSRKVAGAEVAFSFRVVQFVPGTLIRLVRIRFQRIIAIIAGGSDLCVLSGVPSCISARVHGQEDRVECCLGVTVLLPLLKRHQPT
jgi:hypothetical protein